MRSTVSFATPPPPAGEVLAWAGSMSSRVSVLVASDRLPLLLGRFRCAPHDPAWHEVNHIGDVAHVVFPRTAVAITPIGTTTLAADANRVLFYAPGQEYRRQRIDPRGDDCLFLAVGDEAVTGIGSLSPRRGARHDGAGAWAATCPPSVFAALHALRSSHPNRALDPLATEDLLLGILTDVLDDGDPPPASTAIASRVERVRALLAARYREDLSLADIAADVAVSPYHLHRQFRAATGWTPHEYRDHLRLREGLARVLDGATDLAALACDLGFSSHSHFTARFRRAFGVTPSWTRRHGRIADADVRAARS